MALKNISKITNKQISEKGVQALADRPNLSAQYGASGLSATQLKLWFDKLAMFLAERINEISDTLSSDDAANYIRVCLDEYGVDNLYVLIESIKNGSFAEQILKVKKNAGATELQALQNILNDINEDLSKLSEVSKDNEKQLNKFLEAQKGLVDGNIPVWQKNGERFIDSGKKVDDFVSKLPQTSSKATFVYTNYQGKDGSMALAHAADPRTVVRRDASGKAAIATPSKTDFNGKGIINVEYADENLAARKDLVDGNIPVWREDTKELVDSGTNPAGFVKVIDYPFGAQVIFGKDYDGNNTYFVVTSSCRAWSAAQRGRTGNLKASDPVENDDLVSLGYADCNYVHKDSNGDVEIGGTLYLNGDIIHSGKVYETYAEQAYFKKNTVILREGAIGGLLTGEMTGIKALIYNGIDTGILGFDKTGTARVGDEGDAQPLATRAEENELIDGNLIQWNSQTRKLVDSDIAADKVPTNLTNGQGTFSLQTNGATVTITSTDEPKLFNLLNAIPGYENVTSLEVGKAVGNKGSMALCWQTLASGESSLSQGSQTLALGDRSHAEGTKTIAAGGNAHAEGERTVAAGYASHAEGTGSRTTETASYAHAEGTNTVAEHSSSHTEGSGTVSGRSNQTVVGEYNKKDPNAMFVVGNGSGTDDEERSNAFSVNKDGRATIGAPPIEEMDIVNKGFLENFVSSAGANGLSIYAANYGVSASSATIPISNIPTNGRDLQIGDLVITTNSYLYRITAINDTSVIATYLHSLRGSNATTTATATTSSNGLMSAADKRKLDDLYSIGTIYISTKKDSPASFLGGTWEAVGAGRVLVGAGNGYTAGSTGGEATHTLTTEEMPAHSHDLGTLGVDWSGTNSIYNLSIESKTGRGWETSSNGGGKPHNNMPPYLVVYMWERTA